MVRTVARLCSQLLPVALASTCFAADPPPSIYGVYEHASRVCGGPGSADLPVQNEAQCDLSFIDRLEINFETRLSPVAESATSVSFGFHYGYMDACLFNGTGAWLKGRLVLTTEVIPAGSACRLSLSFSNGIARVLDLGGRCKPFLCGDALHKIDGLLFRKVKATTK